ncbi:MAG: exopolysaccharide transport family protein [Roseibium sp.]|uniref:exopolysaccharide transport family protein n=1 Tax=Roseibium sp. TaxID=1936156 RepID=UPI0026099EB5|nr:exopolysaccharide transport family protein [Roseibium sp.]MCV0424434.1 exopolysaccharide transport family protein [Roseibium sp.]
MNAERQTYSEDDMALDLGGLMRAIGRSLGWLLPLTLFVAVAVFLGLQFVAPKYKAEARILIESTDNKFPGASRGIEEERALLDAEGVASQVQLLMSADLARRVAKKLDLAEIPEFDAKGGGSLFGGLMSLVGLGESSSGNSEEERVLKHFYKNLDIYRLEGSRVIAVDFAAENPVLAAKVANTIVDEYLTLQSSAKRETTELASAALEPQILELRKEVQAARQAVSDFRARADLLIGTDNIPLSQQQLAETSSDYSAAQAAKAEAQAKADLIRELLTSGGSLETASDVLNSTLIQRLRERQVEIQSNIAELSITLLPSHPQLKALQSQLGDYDRQIRAEARKVLQGLENDAKVANQQALALEKRLEDLKTAAARTNADQARLSELEREANAKAAQLDQLLLSYQEADSRLRAQVLPADARIISRASVPAEPFSPKVVSSTIIAALVTFILGCAFVIMREFLSGNAIQRVHAENFARSTSASQSVQDVSERASDGSAPQFAEAGGKSDDGFGWERSYGHSVTNYQMNADFDRDPPDTKEIGEVEEVSDKQALFANVKGTEEEETPETVRVSRRSRYDHDVAPDWIDNLRTEPSEDEPESHSEEPLPETETLATTYADEIQATGRIVVLSVDDEALSHDLTFDLARQAAGTGQSALIMEVFPEQSDGKAAEGFSDVVAGQAPFAKVVYRDAASKAHIIEAGRVAISDEMVDTERFKLALDAIKSTYETIVVDLGAIDGTLASARMLSFADRVLIAASAPDHSHELQSAANLLAHNTGAKVEVVIAGGEGPGPRRSDDGHAA